MIVGGYCYVFMFPDVSMMYPIVAVSIMGLFSFRIKLFMAVSAKRILAEKLILQLLLAIF